MTIPKIIHESWHEKLQPLFDDFKMQMILDTISKGKFYPAKEDVFKVFAMPLDKIKVVILGQDPYPNGEATGLAFAARHDAYTPASIKIIRNEVLTSKADLTTSIFYTPEWQTLFHWWKQGVFLLNTALTVEAKQSNSHTNIWQWFTRIIIHEISNQENKPVWLLWGAKAQAYKNYINFVSGNGKNINIALEAAHPAAEAYDPTRPIKFTGCNHFNLTNDLLRDKDQQTINW